MSQPVAPIGHADRVARIRCRDGDHLIEVREREVIAQRLLKTSRKHSFVPDRDVDWNAALGPGTFYMPPHLVSLYETPLWERMTPEQRVELSRQEVCSVASFGITAELALMAGLVSHAAATPYQQAHWAYALVELEDECRHSRMFARMIGTYGLEPHPPLWWQRLGVRIAAMLNDPLRLFAAALVVEEFTDAFQRVAIADETIHPITRQVSRIHVIEEARHIKYAREELKRQVVHRSAARRRLGGAMTARLTRALLDSTIHPDCYRAVGLDAELARRTAARSPHRRQVERWALAKCVRFFHEVGMVDGRARAVWGKVGLLPYELARGSW
ncbi:diiron oxygenase [Planomonospora corallina]|uniref:Diiron oxygenase n=1 Tax=Planomonospora corallina TaxID=1806052 RepID=A0ABV8ICQ4_9ACTN